MCNEELLKNVKLACDENIPKGIEFAWCDLNGNVVRWSDLRATLEVCCGGACKAERTNALLPEEPKEDVTSDV